MVNLAKRSFDVDNQRQVILLTIPPIFLVLAAVVVAVRWHARRAKRINTLFEDLLCVLGLILMVLVVIGIIFLVLLHGQGLPTWYVKDHFGPKVGIEGWLRTQFALDIIWATAVMTVQLSLLQFYTHLYDTRGLYRFIKVFMMAFVVVWYIYAIGALIFFCHPPGKCALIGQKSCIIVGSLHVAFNAIVLGIPIPAVYHMNASASKKLSTIGLFLLGSFCTICAVLRMDCVFPFFADITLDPIGASWGRMLFSPLEIAVAIIACSIPTLTPFYNGGWPDDRHNLPKEGSMLRRLKCRSSSSGSSTTNLHPANWVGKQAGQVNAFVSLEEGGRSSERVRDLGPNDIKVTKEYNVGHRN